MEHANRSWFSRDHVHVCQSPTWNIILDERNIIKGRIRIHMLHYQATQVDHFPSFLSIINYPSHFILRNCEFHLYQSTSVLHNSYVSYPMICFPFSTVNIGSVVVVIIHQRTKHFLCQLKIYRNKLRLHEANYFHNWTGSKMTKKKKPTVYRIWKESQESSLI